MSEWISTKERLPEDKQRILFYAANDWRGMSGIRKGRFAAGGITHNTQFECDSRYLFGESVTHWQPLPPPPEQP